MLGALLRSSIILRHWDIFLLIPLICLFLTHKFVKGRQSKVATFVQKTSIYAPALEEKPHVPYKGVTVEFPGGPHKFYEIMQNRRSVRHFNKHCKPPPRELIEKCILVAGTAPSGAHTEPWTFCLVNDSSLKQQIRQIVEAEEELNYSQRMSAQWTSDLRPLKTSCHKPYLTDAPYLLLVFKQIYGQLADGQRRQHYYNEISTSIAVGLLLCALQTAGLCTLVTTPLNCGPALRKLLQRPAHEKLLVLLPVGYAAADCLVPDLQRKPLEDILVTFYES